MLFRWCAYTRARAKVTVNKDQKKDGQKAVFKS